MKRNGSLIGGKMIVTACLMLGFLVSLVFAPGLATAEKKKKYKIFLSKSEFLSINERRTYGKINGRKVSVPCQVISLNQNEKEGFKHEHN